LRIERDEAVRRSYARDASGLELVPEGVARPADAAEVAELMRETAATRTAVTPAGSQTSTTGASIAERGVLLSLAAMDRVIDVDEAARTARVQPGVRLGELKRLLEPLGLLFPPDPTSEEDATVGGAVACNASGARSLRWGATRPHVRALTVVTAAGETLDLRRPALEKNTVGYAPVHDPVDWFVGSEGTLGVVVEAELALATLPARVLGLALPFASEVDALAFVAAARDELARGGVLRPQCLEFFDERAAAIARDAGGDQRWAADASAVVYLEQDFADGDDEDAALDGWLALASAHRASVADAQAYDGAAALREARRIRHAVPATMNERGAACRPRGGRKVSTDWAVPYRRLGAILVRAREIADAHGIEQAVTYGHAGNGHPHQNFIARDADELHRVEGVVEETIGEVLAAGGTVAAEHGLGKIKKRWLALQLSPVQVAAMRALKATLDPDGRMAPGNVL
jgi:FAD/FMN-containing dehydrogenase